MDRCGKSVTTGLLSLPIELRECIYDYYIAQLSSATFLVARNANAWRWSFHSHSGVHRPPSLLLACRRISVEVQNFMRLKLWPGPIGGVSISRGPTIKVNPISIAPSVGENSHTTVSEGSNIPEALERLLSSSPPSLRLHLVLPQSPTNAALFIAMLRFIVVVCNRRAPALKHVHVVRDPVTGPGWAADIIAIGREASRVRCESISWENWYTQWYAASAGDSNTGPCNDVIESEGFSVDEAWADVLNSCREYKKANR